MAETGGKVTAGMTESIVITERSVSNIEAMLQNGKRIKSQIEEGNKDLVSNESGHSRP